MPSEALRMFAQTVFEKGIAEQDVHSMIPRNPYHLLELDSLREPTPEDIAWAESLNQDPLRRAPMA